MLNPWNLNPFSPSISPARFTQITGQSLAMIWTVLSSTLGMSAIAQPLPTTQIAPPKDTDPPPITTRTGPDRRDCPELGSFLLPIVPHYTPAASEETSGLRYAWSTAPQPTLWFYLPYETQFIQDVTLRIWQWDSATNRIPLYRTKIDNPQQGLIRIVLDPDTQRLNPNIWYQVTLYVDAYCDTTSPIVENETTAFIQISATEVPVDNLPITEQVFQYLDRNLWYDAANLQLQQYCETHAIAELQPFLQFGNLGEQLQLTGSEVCTTASFQSE